VEIVRNSAVNCVYILGCKQLVIVGGAVLDRIKIVGKVAARILGEIADTNDNGLGNIGAELTPACCGASELTTHKTATDNCKANSLFLVIHFRKHLSFWLFEFGNLA
jgi:hypothetical protein